MSILTKINYLKTSFNLTRSMILFSLKLLKEEEHPIEDTVHKISLKYVICYKTEQ